MSLMYPIVRIRLESHALVIRLKENTVGFKVLSAEVAVIDCLPKDQQERIQDCLLQNKTTRPEAVFCFSIYEVEF
jgi:hypothetical protein